MRYARTEFLTAGSGDYRTDADMGNGGADGARRLAYPHDFAGRDDLEHDFQYAVRSCRVALAADTEHGPCASVHAIAFEAFWMC